MKANSCAIHAHERTPGPPRRDDADRRCAMNPLREEIGLSIDTWARRLALLASMTAAAARAAAESIAIQQARRVADRSRHPISITQFRAAPGRKGVHTTIRRFVLVLSGLGLASVHPIHAQDQASAAVAMTPTEMKWQTQ